jgi:hypothetical protein
MKNEQEKLFLLDLIYENKERLFGKFTASLTAKNKEGLWSKLHDQCVAMGFTLVPVNCGLPPWRYLRDTIWASNMKRRTLEKRDKKLKQTGSSGGKEMIYSSVEQRVLDILGENGALVEGLKSSESSAQFDISKTGSSSSLSTFTGMMNDDTHVIQRDACWRYVPQKEGTSSSRSSFTSLLMPTSVKSVTTRPIMEATGREEIGIINVLKRRNLELEVDIRELKKQKLCLEIERLEFMKLHNWQL